MRTLCRALACLPVFLPPAFCQDGVHLQLLGSTPGSPVAVAMAGDLTVCSEGLYRVIYDTGTQDQPEELSRHWMGASIREIVLRGAREYMLSNDGRLRFHDLANPGEPLETGAWNWAQRTNFLAVDEPLVCSVLPDSGLALLDCSVFGEALPAGFVPIPSPVFDLAAADGLACLAADDLGVLLVDLVGPGAPVLLDTLQTGQGCRELELIGRMLYALDTFDSLFVYNLGDALEPVLVDQLATGGVYAVAAVDSLLLLHKSSTTEVLDVRDPVSILPMYELPVGSHHRASGVAQRVAFTLYSGELVWYGLTQGPEPVELARIQGSYDSQCLREVVDPLYATRNNRYLELFDFTNPRQPARIAALEFPTHIQDLDVRGGLACVLLTDNSLWTVDLGIPDQPTQIGFLELEDNDWGVSIGDGFAVLRPSGMEGARIVDLSDPAEPHLLGAVSDGGLLSVVLAWDRHAFVRVSGGPLEVYDLEDPAAPVRVAEWPLESLIGLERSGNLLACRQAGHLLLLDASDPEALVEVLDQPLEFPISAGCADGLCFIQDYQELVVLDLETSGGPAVVHRQSGMGSTLFDIHARQGRFVAAGGGLEAWGWERETTIGNTAPLQPERIALLEAHPNPFNPVTRLGYDLARSGNVRLVVYDLLGRQVRTLVDGVQETGHHQVEFIGNGLSGGVYFCELTVDHTRDVVKLILLP